MTVDEKKALKGRGIIPNRDGEHFSARVLTVDGTLTSAQLRDLADAAEKFGAGRVGITARLSVEVVGLSPDTIPGFDEFAQTHGMQVGGTGPKVRPITACKGTVCVWGNIDTQALARRIHERFYIGWGGVKLPHKFKIGVGGCRNNCMKPDLNDFGIMGFRRAKDGQPAGVKVFIGGKWGRANRHGTELPGVYTEDEAVEMLERALLLYCERANPAERFGDMIDRVGAETVSAEIISGDIQSRKSAILAAR